MSSRLFTCAFIISAKCSPENGMAVATAGRTGLNRNRFWKNRFFGKCRSFEFRLQPSIFGLKLSESVIERVDLRFLNGCRRGCFLRYRRLGLEDQGMSKESARGQDYGKGNSRVGRFFIV